jgi:DNA-binding response OmpR family regulator
VSTPRILVVDHARHLLHSFASALHPYEVAVASNGALALSRLAASPAFDLVLCELDLPDLHGRTLYRVACTRSPELRSRFLFLTSESASPSQYLDVETSAVPVLAKPFDDDVLRAAVNDLLSRVPPRAEV